MKVALRASPPMAGFQPQGSTYPQVSLVCSTTSSIEDAGGEVCFVGTIEARGRGGVATGESGLRAREPDRTLQPAASAVITSAASIMAFANPDTNLGTFKASAPYRLSAGMVKVKTLPSPGVLCTVMVPP